MEGVSRLETRLLCGMLVDASVSGIDERSQNTCHAGTHSCFPEKINRCWGGGTPDCSSTFSFNRMICSDAIGESSPNVT